MAHAVNYEFVAFEDYLTGERDVDVRSEYVDGLIHPMNIGHLKKGVFSIS